MPWMIFAILLALLDTLSSEVACNRLADIYWNATNPIFRIDNTDHIIDVNKGNERFVYDQVNIICPVYPHTNQGTKSEDDDDENTDSEQYIIYNVSKEEYDSCRITNPNPRIIALCDNPNQVRYFTITFRSFTPQPGGLEFVPGHDYYFVSTSSGDLPGLNQLVGGRCASHNMKVIFKVCCNPSKGSPAPPLIPSSPPPPTKVAPASTAVAPRSRNGTGRPLETKVFLDDNAIRVVPVGGGFTTGAPAPGAVTFGGAPRRHWPSFTMPPYLRPYEVPIEDEMDRSPPADKNKGSREKPPKRERAKNEELVNGVPSQQSHRWRTTIILSLLVCLLQQLQLLMVCR